MQMNINLHVAEVNAAITLFSGVAENIRAQALAIAEQQEAEAKAAANPPAPPAPPVEPPAPVVRAVKKVVKRK